MSTLCFCFGGWRGFHYEKPLFGPVVRFGFLTLIVSKYDLPDWIHSWHGKLTGALKKADGVPTGKGQMK